jgi:hypothetical protein
VFAAIAFHFHGSNMAQFPKHFVTVAEQLFQATCAIFIVLGRSLPGQSKKFQPMRAGPVGQFRATHRKGRVE